MAVELETIQGDSISVNPALVVKLKPVKPKNPDAQPTEWTTTVTFVGGSQETVKGTRREVEQKLGAGWK
jgi:hypothetical protein